MPLGRRWVEAPPPLGLGLVLDRAFEDIGRSGYHGTHRKLGQFGAYLKMIQDGKVPRNKVWLLEAIHRFGRENVPIAMDNFQLIKAGIIIVTTMDRRIYSEEAIHKDPSLLTYLENQMQAAHNESKFCGGSGFLDSGIS
jgi:hypothetical protein